MTANTMKFITDIVAMVNVVIITLTLIFILFSFAVYFFGTSTTAEIKGMIGKFAIVLAVLFSIGYVVSFVPTYSTLEIELAKKKDHIQNVIRLEKEWERDTTDWQRKTDNLLIEIQKMNQENKQEIFPNLEPSVQNQKGVIFKQATETVKQYKETKL